MIERYTHPEMGHIWTLENEFRTMLQVEILACEAMNKLGIVPDDALKDIQTKADFRIERHHCFSNQCGRICGRCFQIHP